MTKQNSRHKDTLSYVHSLKHNAVFMQAARAAGVAEGTAAAAVEIKPRSATLRDGSDLATCMTAQQRAHMMHEDVDCMIHVLTPALCRHYHGGDFTGSLCRASPDG